MADDVQPLSTCGAGGGEREGTKVRERERRESLRKGRTDGEGEGRTDGEERRRTDGDGRTDGYASMQRRHVSCVGDGGN